MSQIETDFLNQKAKPIFLFVFCGAIYTRQVTARQ